MAKEYAENNLQSKSLDFAIKIVNLYKNLAYERKEYVLSKQILKSGTSIGANVAEAFGGISKADFTAKISIAYKECLETKYWLRLMKASEFISKDEFNILLNNCEELGKIMYTMIKKYRPV